MRTLLCLLHRRVLTAIHRYPTQGLIDMIDCRTFTSHSGIQPWSHDRRTKKNATDNNTRYEEGKKKDKPKSRAKQHSSRTIHENTEVEGGVKTIVTNKNKRNEK